MQAQPTRTEGRSKELWALSRYLFNGLLGEVNLAREEGAAPEERKRVGIGVVPDGVALRLDAPQNLWTALDVLATDEECGFHIMAAQNVENLSRIARTGAIVEGKGDSISSRRATQKSGPEKLQSRNTPGVHIQTKHADSQHCAN